MKRKAGRRERRQKALWLAMRGVEWLYGEDPDFVLGGCSDVSEVLSRFLKGRGYGAEVLYGRAKKGVRGEPFMHAWLWIEGEEFDPVLWVQDADIERHRYRLQPAVKEALTCPDPEALDAYVGDLEENVGAE